jgi:hypothetical protein
MISPVLRLAASLLLPLALAGAVPGLRAQFIGGTLSSVSPKTDGRLDVSGADSLVFRAGRTEVRIDYRRVNTLEYGQSVGRRIAEAILISPLMLLSKSRKHFVTIGYTDSDGAQQVLVLRVEKGDIRAALASLEARTGRKVQYLDEEARKGGK